MSVSSDLARIAYTAYGDSTGWVNYQGKPMPAWDDLPDTIRQAWAAAASAIEQRLLTDAASAVRTGQIKIRHVR